MNAALLQNWNGPKAHLERMQISLAYAKKLSVFRLKFQAFIGDLVPFIREQTGAFPLSCIWKI